MGMKKDDWTPSNEHSVEASDNVKGNKRTNTKSFKNMIKQIILKVQFLKTRSRGNSKKKSTITKIRQSTEIASLSAVSIGG